MFEKPAKKDIDAALSILMHEARRQVQDAKNQVISDAIKSGVLQSDRVIIAIADDADKVHKASMERAKKILIDFIERMQLPATQIAAWARPHLENLSNSVIGVVPPNGFPNDHQRGVHQYLAVFKQRVDLVLRDVEIGYSWGEGFAARIAMPKEEWISAAETLRLFGKHSLMATDAICNRAKAGMVRARAARILKNGRITEEVEVPPEFWSIGGKAALEQNWHTGDFGTWNGDDLRLEAFGVTFLRTDIEAMIPASATRSTQAAAPEKSKGGRPPAPFWDDLWVEMCRQIYGGVIGVHSKQADIAKAMSEWASMNGHHPVDSTIKERARKLRVMLDKEDEN